jgi:hypothetical protein
MNSFITRAFSAITATVILGITTSVLAAASPESIASQAYRGQLKGINGYQQLQVSLASGRLTAKDLIKAAGETPTPQLERDVQTFVTDYFRN